MKRIFKMIGIVAAVIGGLFFLIGLLYAWSTGAFVRASHVRLDMPTQAVTDARQLIREFQQTRDRDESARSLAKDDLPVSLRIPKLRYAVVFTNHLNLVMGRNPDWSIGARIWLDQPPDSTADRPTRYPDVLFYEYCNDLPVSVSNHP